jgi:SAM-dependent methyltransferase
MATPLQPREHARLCLAIVLLSTAMLSFQILQVAVLGLQLLPEAAFLVVSLSMLGLGSGGSVAALIRRWRPLGNPTRLLWSCAVGFSVGIAVSMVATSRLHGLLALILVNTAPYLFMGVFLALAFAAWPERANRTYFFDLVGAGIGCLAIVALLHGLADAGLVTLVLAGLGGVAASILAMSGTTLQRATSVGLIVALAALAPWRATLFPFTPDPEKFYGQLLARGAAGGRLERMKWNHLGRLDSVVPGPAIADFPFAHQAKDLIDAGCEFRLLFSNGYNWTYTIDFKGKDAERRTLFATWAQNTPYVFTQSPEVLNLGSGGGGDVYLAALHGARRITGVEINPLMIEACTEWYPGDWDGLWHRPEVELVELDARTYVGTTDRRFDVVTLNAVDTGGTQASLLAANFLYTIEAFGDYLHLLRPGGVVFLTRPRDQLLRAVTAAVAALRARGAVDPARHVAVVGTGELLSAAIYVDPLSPGQVEVLRQKTAADELGGGPQYLPGVPLPATTFTDYFAAVAADDDARYLATATLLLDPTTDDRPYFYQLERGFLGSRAGRLLSVILLWVTSLGMLLLFAPLMGLRIAVPRGVVLGHLVYFGAIGIGFMLAEIALINELSLFLGHPVHSLTVTLMTMLVFSGMGSLAAGRLADRGRSPIVLALALGCASLATYACGLDRLVATHLSALAARIALVIACLAPASIFLGMPLPLKLRTFTGAQDTLVPWAWAVNGFASVAGSVLAVALAMNFGFRSVLALAAAAYATALLAHLATGSRAGGQAPRGTS